MTQEQGNLDNYRWLVGPEARLWLEMVGASTRSLVTLSQSLRKELGVARTHLVIAQVELRRRAKVKFRQAEHMFFTRQLLEQATDEAIAAYKASRFPAGEPIVDLCCGIGGDLLGLAARAQTTAVDRSPVAALLAEANSQATGRNVAEFVVADVAGYDVSRFAAWHLDPDRRVRETRTTTIEYQEPGPETVERVRQANPCGVVKLAPAAVVPDRWAEQGEREWIGSRGECRQQAVWFGPLARRPGQHAATVVSTGPDPPYTIFGRPDVIPPVASALGRYIFEPHAAILAARLTGVLAERHGLQTISPGVAYLTGDRPVLNAGLSCFEIVEVLPFDLKTLRAALRARQIGKLEVKKRGIRVTPEQVRTRIRPKGEENGTLLLTKVQKKVKAILTRRVHPPERTAKNV